MSRSRVVSSRAAAKYETKSNCKSMPKAFELNYRLTLSSVSTRGLAEISITTARHLVIGWTRTKNGLTLLQGTTVTSKLKSTSRQGISLQKKALQLDSYRLQRLKQSSPTLVRPLSLRFLLVASFVVDIGRPMGVTKTYSCACACLCS